MSPDGRYAIIVPLTPTTAGDLQSTIDTALRAYVEQPAVTLEATPGEEAPWVLRTPEVARLVGLAPSTVEDMARRGEIPSFRVGTARCYRREELLAWLDARIAEQRDGPR